MVGVCRRSRPPMCPRPLGSASDQPSAGLWQLAQEMTPEPDKRGSKNNIWPRATFSGVEGLLRDAGVLAGRRNSSSWAWRVVAPEAPDSDPADASNSVRELTSASAHTDQ